MVMDVPYLLCSTSRRFVADLNSELVVLNAACMSRLFRLQNDCTQRLIRYENSRN